jgi:DNA-binding CsgD family transcriptional regulator
VELILTDREAQVASLVAQGLGNEAIADELGISRRTVETHVSNILKRNQLENRTQLAHGVLKPRAESFVADSLSDSIGLLVQLIGAIGEAIARTEELIALLDEWLKLREDRPDV